MVRMAYVTAEVDYLDPDPDWDMPGVVAGLAEAGFDVETPHWDDPNVDWSRFDACLVRSTWNYANRRDDFVAWAKHVDAVSLLLNPSDVIEYNTDKVYLRDLTAAGVPVIPTIVVAPGESCDWTCAELAHAARVVVKPTVGAGAIGASVHHDLAAADEAIAALHATGASVLVQPYLDAVDTAGEVAVVVIDGDISHAVTKVPALTVGGHGDAGALQPVDASIESMVASVAATVPQWPDLLYARVDIVPDGRGGWLLMELELTEPTLFLTQDAAATARFVDSCVKRFRD